MSTRRADFRVIALTALFVAAVVPYLIALWSPVRLAPDSIVYLARAHGIPDPPGFPDYPPGYPALVKGLGHVGLDTPAGLVGLNLVLLAIGLVAAYYLCRRELGLGAMTSACLCLATLLSHTTSFYAPTPMSDVPFFGVAMICLLALSFASRRSGWRRWALLALGALLAAGGVSIRTAGVALVPPVLFVALGQPRLSSLWRPFRRRGAVGVLLGAGALALLATITVLAVSESPYSHDVAHSWRLGGGFSAVADRWSEQAKLKVLTAGEVGAQASCCARVPREFTAGFVVLGVGVLGLLVLGWRHGRRRLELIDVFLLSTAAVIVVYPSGGVARLWLAALPFVLAYALFGAAYLARWRPLKIALFLYTGFFTIAGFGWLADSIRITTLGADFPRWGEKTYPGMAASYRVAYGRPRAPGDHSIVIPAAVEALRRYGAGPPR